MTAPFAHTRLLVTLTLLAVLIAQPCSGQTLSDVAARVIEPRGEFTAVEKSTIALFKRVSPSVLQVVAKTEKSESFFSESGMRSGTGFIWDSAGHVVTNNHVAKGATSISVRLTTGEVLSADVAGVAPNYDLAVIRLKAHRGLPAPFPIDTSTDLQIGQLAFAIGNPFGLDQSLTAGVISALKRRLPTTEGHEIARPMRSHASSIDLFVTSTSAAMVRFG